MTEPDTVDYRAAKAGYNAAIEATNRWQMRGGGCGFVGCLAFVTLLNLSRILALSLLMVGVFTGLYCMARSFAVGRHIGHYRRKMAEAAHEHVAWYTRFTDTPQERAQKIRLWKEHPIALSLFIGVQLAVAVLFIVARLRLAH